MGRRFKRKRLLNLSNLSNKNKVLNILIVLFSLIVVSIVFAISFFSKKSSPTLMRLAEVEARKMASIIITQTVNYEMAESLMVDDLIITTKNENDEIVSVDFDPILLNKLLLRISNQFIFNLRCLEEGNLDDLTIDKNLFLKYRHDGLSGIFYMVPTGIVFGVPFLANLGPQIPIRFNFIGDMITNLNTEARSYGINNVLFTVSVHVKMTEEVIVPLMSKKITVEMDVPITIKLIQGKVPTFYNGFMQSSPSLTVPTVE